MRTEQLVGGRPTRVALEDRSRARARRGGHGWKSAVLPFRFVSFSALLSPHSAAVFSRQSPVAVERCHNHTAASAPSPPLVVPAHKHAPAHPTHASDVVIVVTRPGREYRETIRAPRAMDKQQEAAAAAAGTPSEDSISMKTEYPAHEVFVSEPPPVRGKKQYHT